MKKVVAVFALVLAAFGGAAHGCAVCYGGADDAMTTGMNNGILTLLGVVAVVQIGFVGMFWSFRRRSRDLDSRREKFHLMDGGAK